MRQIYEFCAKNVLTGHIIVMLIAIRVGAMGFFKEIILRFYFWGTLFLPPLPGLINLSAK